DQLGRLAVSLTALHLVLLWYRSGHLGRLATRVALPPILRSRRTTRPRRDLPLSVLDGDPHRPGGAGDDLLRRLNVIGVEVGHLPLRDLTQLSLGDRAHLRRVRRPRALLDAGRLDEQPS